MLKSSSVKRRNAWNEPYTNFSDQFGIHLNFVRKGLCLASGLLKLVKDPVYL